MTFDLSTWNQVIKRSYKGKRIANSCYWEQIPVQEIKVTKPNVLVRLSNPYAPKHWYRAGTVSIFGSGISIVRIQSSKIALKELTFLDIKVEDSSYLLKFWFPWWHEQIDIEVYQKDRVSNDIKDCLDDLKKRVDDISTTVL